MKYVYASFLLFIALIIIYPIVLILDVLCMLIQYIADYLAAGAVQMCDVVREMFGLPKIRDSTDEE